MFSGALAGALGARQICLATGPTIDGFAVGALRARMTDGGGQRTGERGSGGRMDGGLFV